jgi:Transcription factor Opi1
MNPPQDQYTPPLSPEKHQRPLSVVHSSDLSTVLANMKRDIANTLRRMVELIGKYASAFLSGDAQNRVRGYIMTLPAKWVLHIFIFLIGGDY